jgi:hypothetical protein
MHRFAMTGITEVCDIYGNTAKKGALLVELKKDIPEQGS